MLRPTPLLAVLLVAALSAACAGPTAPPAAGGSPAPATQPVSGTYTIDAMMDDVRKGVWSELSTKKPIDVYRRNLQKAYTEALIDILDPKATSPSPGRGASASPNSAYLNTDVISMARAQLSALRSQINAAIPATSDKMSKYHLQDVSERIKFALDPRG